MKHTLLFTLAVVICALASCSKDGGNSGDWYNGGMDGDYATFTVEFNATSNWETTVFHLNIASGNWFSFSPTSGKAGANQVTFRVSKNEYLESNAEVAFRMVDSDDSFDISFDSENGSSDLYLYGEEITGVDISLWTQLDELTLYEYGATAPNLKEIWMKQGQSTEIYYEGSKTWEIKYK